MRKGIISLILIFALLLSTVFPALALDVDNSPIIVYPPSGQALRTLANYEIKDDNVIFDFALLNLSSSPQTVTFLTGQQFEITITDMKGNEVYRFSDGKAFTQAKTIQPGSFLAWQDKWDMTDKYDQKVGPGEYKAVITVLAAQQVGDKYIMFDKSQVTAVIYFYLND